MFRSAMRVESFPLHHCVQPPGYWFRGFFLRKQRISETFPPCGTRRLYTGPYITLLPSSLLPLLRVAHVTQTVQYTLFGLPLRKGSNLFRNILRRVPLYAELHPRRRKFFITNSVRMSQLAEWLKVI